jgi:putative transposase
MPSQTVAANMLTYRFRLYPTPAQVKILDDTLETWRHLYNDSLDERSKEQSMGFWEQKQLLTLRKPDNKYYKQVHSQVLQDVLLRLDKAYQRFFKKLARYPKFKRKGKCNSFSYPQYGGWQIRDNKLALSRIGAIRFKMHRIPVGTLKRCTVIRDIDQWYCCIAADDGIDIPEQKPIQNAVRVDVGLLNWMTMSDGNKIQNTIDFEAQAKRIKELQRCLARKKKDSHNREKERIQQAKMWRRVRRHREDFVHKASKALADNYDTIVFEKLNIGNMVKNHSLAQAIMGVTWGKLRLYTAYKVERRGGRCLGVNPSVTSQKCSRRGVAAKA